ncbi:glutaminase liver isoform, mitochondrial isoform X1 [Takifugu rubripes]|uniref:glutaminase liver isoform, mitochondrial isoform X1 n=1 Tax=Takifugu rubripes TaxID=31033 RepID=UPI0011455038|nr:glutaminase liver isoform, mitochondrial-like isoform X1 [Takifugu rubripes]XP_056907835.1 glutaminase liver isoform, mitochondrial isoform X1 [Takifugu flavidus]XP_056907836.1 glutaminase liver isoform, mitochondrial isoform X1 [Takifugu flavidus]
MEPVQNQEPEDNSYLCFQRTSSLRRKWRKRYGGLDGNKLLEPNKDPDVKDYLGITDDNPQQRFEETASCSFPGTLTQNQVQTVGQGLVQKPISLVSPGSAANNGCLKPPLPQAVVQPEDRGVPLTQPWSPPQQTPSRRRAAADVLFDSFASEGRLHVNQFFEAIWNSGLHKSDPRLRECFFHLRKLQDADGSMDRNTFHRCITGFVSLILKALQGRFVIPDFSTFTEETQKLFSRCRQLLSVQEKEKDSMDSMKWGVAVCTVDGQRLTLGDWAGSLALGELSWPVVYGVAVDLLGSDLVHRYVGMEGYSRYDSPFTLTKTGIPHSPLTETGAIITTSLLQLAGRLSSEEEEKYDSVLNVIQRLCNKEHASLNCSSYQRNRKASVRLHGLSFYLQEKKCFPDKVDINAVLDLMLQCCSTELTCESGAAMAASLANGGLCPLSGDQVLSPAATRSMLSMMQVAGMKEYSSTFQFKTSIPAVSSSHGSLLAVVPGVLGLMAFSPELDACGNPWRAIHFCQELISTFQLHSFDIRTPFRQILAYRQWKAESEGYQIINVLLAAFKGDVQALRRYFLSGVDVKAVDYDGRTALHVAAAEGHAEVIRFLLENVGANPALKDRWGSSPLQEARRHNREAAIQLLQAALTS